MNNKYIKDLTYEELDACILINPKLFGEAMLEKMSITDWKKRRQKRLQSCLQRNVDFLVCLKKIILWGNNYEISF